MSTKQYRAANKEAIREYDRQWRERNPEKVKAIAARSYRNRREKCIAQTKAWRQRYPKRRRESDFKRKYGITLRDYDALLRSQGGGCGICGVAPEQTSKKRLFVDHDHQTGKARGLLCNKHNRAIGLFGDDPDLLTKAAMYLTEHQQTLVPIAA